MLELLAAVIVALVPVSTVIGLLVLAGRVQRRREEATAQQARVTDAIHKELGPVAAPLVATRVGRPWQVLIPMPVDRPGLTSKVLTVAHRALAGSPTRFEIVFVPRDARQEPR